MCIIFPRRVVDGGMEANGSKFGTRLDRWVDSRAGVAQSLLFMYGMSNWLSACSRIRTPLDLRWGHSNSDGLHSSLKDPAVVFNRTHAACGSRLRRRFRCLEDEAAESSWQAAM